MYQASVAPKGCDTEVTSLRATLWWKSRLTSKFRRHKCCRNYEWITADDVIDHWPGYFVTGPRASYRKQSLRQMVTVTKGCDVSALFGSFYLRERSRRPAQSSDERSRLPWFLSSKYRKRAINELTRWIYCLRVQDYPTSISISGRALKSFAHSGVGIVLSLIHFMHCYLLSLLSKPERDKNGGEWNTCEFIQPFHL